MKSTTTTGAFRWMVALCMVIILSAATLTAAYGQSATPVKDSQETRDDEDGGGGPTLAPAPSGLSADSSTRTSVSLSWDSLTNAYRYKLERREGTTGTWVTVSSYISGTSTSRTAYGLTCGLTYYFRISARGDGSPYTTSFGTASSSVSRATTTCPNATAPSGLSADSSNVNSVSLSWNSRTNASWYRVERSISSAGPWTTVSSYISGSSYTARFLACNTTYHFRVSARGDGSPLSTTFSAPSSSVSRATTTCPDATAPTGLRATSSAQTSVSLRWNSVTNTYRYKLEHREGSTGSWSTVSSSVSGTTYTVSSLTCATTHYFRVSAKGDGSPLSTTFSSASSTVSRSTTTCPNAPSPTGLSAGSPTRTSISVSWNSVTGANWYKLERATSSSGPWTMISLTTSTSRTATGLTCGTTYHFRIKARGDGSPYSVTYGNASSPVSRATTTCPNAPAPTGLSAGSSTNTSVSLSWNSVTNAYRYRLERSTRSSGPWTVISSTISSTSHTATGLTPGLTYYFKVSARGDGSPYSTTFGSASSPVSIDTPVQIPPVPTGLRATANTYTGVSLSWYSLTNAYRYKLERSTSSTGPWTTVSSTISGTSSTVTGLIPGLTYYFRVSARGDGSPYSTTFGTASSPVSRPTDPYTPPTLTGLRATANTENGVSLSWNSLTDAAAYKLERSLSSSGPWTVVSSTIPSTSTSHTAAGLTCGLTYYFRVSARGDGSPYSTTFGTATSPVSRDTGTCPTAPAPTGLEAAASTATGISLSWTAVTDAAAYKMEQREGSTGPWTEVSSTITSTSHDVTGLTCNTTYYFRVSANGDGSPYSATFGSPSTGSVSRDTGVCPTTAPAPTGLGVSSSTATSVTLTWDAVTDAAAYKLERSDSSTGPWTEVSSTITSTSHDVTGLTCNTTYYFRVSANGDGSPYSATFGSPSTGSVSRDTGVCPTTAPAPAGLGVSSSTATSVTLTWDAVTDAAAYKLERSASSTGPWTTVSSTITSTSHSATGLTNGTAYHFRVSAKGDGSPYSTTFGDHSSSLSETLGSTLASAPTGLTADSSTEHSVTLSWDAVTDGAAYKVEWSASSTGPWSEASSDITAITYEVTDLTCDTTHYFRVSARGDGSPHSNAFGSPTTSSVSRATTACINDQPVFTSSTYSFTVSEDAEVYASVGTTSATDEDTSDTVSYSITTGNGDGKFDIDSSTGEITVAELLDFETTSSYTLTIQASDGNGGTGTATVTITVTDVLESSINADVSDPWAGQTATITATTDAPAGSTLSYQWQEWSSGAWSNLGTASTTGQYSATSTTAGTKFFRVVVTPTTGSASESPPIAVQWKPLVVTVTSSPDFPESGDASKRTVTLKATVEGPTGVSYQWQEWSGTAWTNLGTASTSTTKTVSSTSRGTKKYRAVVSHATATSAQSEEVFVTWDEWAIQNEMLSTLALQVTASQAYMNAEVALLDCLERRTGTRYSSLTNVMSRYKDAVKTAVDACDQEGADASNSDQMPLSPTGTFDNLHGIFKTTLRDLKSENATYAGLLDTPQGRDFLDNVAQPRLVKYTAAIITTQVRNPGGGPEGESGPREEGEGNGLIPPNMLSCLMNASTLDEKLRMLNCLIFNTSFEDWVTVKQNAEADGSDFENIVSRFGLDDGDFICSDDWIVFGIPVIRIGSTEREEAVCLKHDVAWNSLQEFVGDPPGADLQGTMDEAWNPRNKFLADAQAYIEWTCAEFQGSARIGCLNGNLDYWEHVGHYGLGSARLRTKFISDFNDLGWPITEQDVDHARETPRYVECEGPVPKASGFLLSQHGQTHTVSWSFEPGCAVQFENVFFRIDWVERGNFFSLSYQRKLHADVDPGSICTSTSAGISCSYSFNNRTLVEGSDIILSIYPKDKTFGPANYPERLTVKVP